MQHDDAVAVHQMIMAACQRGALSPQAALRYARDAASGEDISYVANLAGMRDFAVAAAASTDLPSQVWSALNGTRHVTAHSHQQALQQSIDALKRGHPANLTEDDLKLAKLFPPSAPYTPPDEDDPESLTGPHGHYQPKIKRPVEDQQKRASARIAEELADKDAPAYNGIFGKDGRTYAQFEPDNKLADPRVRQLRAAAADLEDDDDDELFAALYPQQYRRTGRQRRENGRWVADD